MSEVTLVSTGLTGGGILTMQKRIEQEIHRASPNDQDAIKIAIITAMEWFKPFHFYFNQATDFFDLTVGQEEYPVATPTTAGWPADMVAPMNVFVKTGGTRWLIMKQITMEDQRWLQPTDTVQGLPSAWAWHDFKMYMTPRPSEENLEIRIDYVKDLGIPRYYWNGTEWAYVLPNSNAPMENTYTNDWIIYAEELIRQRAKWDLYFNYYDDQENAQKMYDAVGLTLGNVKQRSNNYTRNVGRKPTYV